MASNENEKDETSFSVYNTNDEYHSEFGNINESANLSTCNNMLYPVNELHKSVIVSSPTGSGKTVIFELAIIHFLEKVEKGLNNLENSKIIYVAPVKALCSERHEDWKNKFSSYGLKCVEITGDTEFSNDLFLLSNHQLIITTPEKWDSLTRKCKELNYLLHMVKLFLIDEVHLVNEGTRGAALETIVSRMKMIPKTTKLYDFKLRFVAVSATVSNIEDIAKWLCCDQEHSAHYLKSNEDERPVKLQKIVLGYNSWSSGFKFDLDLTYKLKPLIDQYSNGRPTLIFCPTRKSVEFTCTILAKDTTTSLCDDKKGRIDENLKEINSNKIKEFVKLGIGCHHAGMSLQERNAQENLFRMGCLNILVATSTLAIGVNLPAHLVIIKSTEHYTFNGYREYNECQILQMIGRAGRPQYDTTATAIIMTKISMKSRYEEILIGNQIVESHLHKHLIEHLNAEIFLGTIYDITVAMDWIRSTFLYVRACKVPQKYGMIKTLNVNKIESTLQNLCLEEIKLLASTGLINYDNIKIDSRPEGEIMAKYLISFETMKSFMHLKGTENLSDMISLLARSKEFESIKFRKSEKAKLNILNKNKVPGVDIIRFPIEEGINNRETKINCLIQATLGTLQIMDNSLTQDANKIIFIAIRLAKAIREITYRSMHFEIARIACILVKCLITRLWEQSKFVSKLIPKIGPILSKEFVLNGKTTLQSIRDTDPRDLEQFLNRHPPFGNHIHDFICKIPKYEVRACFDEYLELVSIKIILINYKNIPENTRLHAVSILVGDSDNNLLKVQHIRNEEFSQQGTINMTVSLKNQVLFDKSNYTVTVCLISDQWVGIDVEVKFKPWSHEEHVNESMNEDNHDILVVKSPLKTFSFPQPMKRKRTLKIDKNQKTQKKEKTQMNIQKYLHNVSSEDQDPTVSNKLHVEKNKDIGFKCDTNESNVVTQKCIYQVIETHTNSLNNKCTNEEYIKFDEDNLNKYSCYDELVNDNVFHDLFVPDDNFHVISKAFDSAIEKYGFIENVRKIKNLKNIMQNDVSEPMKLQCSTENNKVLMNDEPCFRTTKACVGKPNEIPTKYKNQYSKNNFSQLLEDKENVNPYKIERLKKCFSNTLKQDTTSKLTQTPTTAPLNEFTNKKNNFTNYSKSIETNNVLFSSRTQNRNRSDNVNDFKFGIASTSCEANIPVKNLKTSINQSAVVGRLSRRIETNLKASTNFYVPLDEEIQSEVIADNSFEKNMSISIGSEQTRSNRFSVSTPIRNTSTRRSGKAMLDKYFKAVKTPRSFKDLNVDRFIVTSTAINGLTKNSVDDYRQSLNALQIDDERPRPKINFGDGQFFNRHFSIHHYNKAESENLQANNTTGNSLRYYFPTSADFKNHS